jgi:hypothetical protein
MTEKRIITDRVEMLAMLDTGIAYVKAARDVLLPLRLPVATECAYLSSTLDLLRKLRSQADQEFSVIQPTTQGEKP